jgi:nitroreductase
MDFRSLINQRRSIRAYGPEPPSDAAMNSVLEAVVHAPSAGNLQAFRMRLVQGEENMKGLATAAHGQDFLARAPLALVFLADPKASARQYGDRGRDLYAVQDATIACLYAHLACVEAGLASAWIGAFSADTVSRVLRTPPGLVPIAILAVGYAAEEPEPMPRKALSDLMI